MKLTVLGSSSSGNGYILEDSEGNALLLEAGVRLKEVKKALDFNIRGIVGCLITHMHGDHIGHVNQYLDAGIDIYTHIENKVTGHRFRQLESKKEVSIGPWKIKPFDVIHDVPTFGFLIDHPESGKVCFITDTAYCKYTFPGLNNIIIEANYCEEIMMKRFLEGSLNGVVRARTMKSHMSLQSTLEFLGANDLSQVNQVILIHLSGGNSDPEQFHQKTSEATGKTVHIAKPGAEFQLTKTPF